MNFKIEIEPNHGIIVVINNELEADEFDDYLTEERYIKYDLRSDNDKTSFFFGEGSNENSIKKIIMDFKEKNEPK